MKTSTQLCSLFLLAVLSAAAIRAQESQDPARPDIFDKALVLVSALPGNPVVVRNGSVCSVAASDGAKPLRLKIVPGLSDGKSVSFESAESPGFYLKHQDWRCLVLPFRDEDDSFAATATFNLVMNSDGTYSLEAASNPNCYLTVFPTGTVKLVAAPDPLRRSFLLRAEPDAAASP